MNKILIVVTSLALLLGIFVTRTTQAAPVETEQNVNELSKMSIHISHPTSSPKIDEKTALENAKATFPKWASDANNVKIEYQIMTNDSFNAFSPEALEKNSDLKKKNKIDNLPVYIISFKGMSYEAKTPHGYKGKPFVHHEYNVVVDAATGVPLFGYSYR